MRRDVNIPIGLIMIAILALLLALGWLFKMEIPKRASERYQNELKAEADLLSRIKPVVHNGVIMLPVLIDGDLKWQRQEAAQAQQATPQAEQTQPASDEVVNAWQVAVDLVAASVAASPDSKQLISAAAFGSGSGYSAATEVLKDKGWIITVTGGRNAGAFVRDEIGTVKALLPKVALESAIKSLPRPAQRVTG